MPEVFSWAASLLFRFPGESMVCSFLLTLASLQSQADEAYLRARKSVVIVRLQIELGIKQGRLNQAVALLQVLEQQHKYAKGAAAAELGEQIREARMSRDVATMDAKCLEALITHADKWRDKPKK